MKVKRVQTRKKQGFRDTERTKEQKIGVGDRRRLTGNPKVEKHRVKYTREIKQRRNR